MHKLSSDKAAVLMLIKSLCHRSKVGNILLYKVVVEKYKRIKGLPKGVNIHQLIVFNRTFVGV